MKNKISLILNIVLSVMLICLLIYTVIYKDSDRGKGGNTVTVSDTAADNGNEKGKVKEKEEGEVTAAESVTARIEEFVKSRFGFDFENHYGTVSIDNDAGEYTVNIEFVPVVFSYIVKSDIYETAGEESYMIAAFFPEVKRFNYTVLWNWLEKKEAMKLIIDEEAVEDLYDRYWDAVGRKNDGEENPYKDIFSSIIETEESKTWREVVDKNATVP